MSTKKAVATKDSATDIAHNITNLPEHLKGATDIGNKNVSQEDLTTPRLAVLQDLSPELKKRNAKFVDGAEAGMIMNTLTKKLYSDIRLVNCYYDKIWLVFKQRKHGGGFLGAGKTRAEAEALRDSQAQAGEYEVVETAQHYCLVIGDDNSVVERVIFPMQSTKLSFSRAWNSMIVNNHKDLRAACVWTVSTVMQSSTKGDFYNLTITEPPQWVSAEILEEAKKFAEIASNMDAAAAYKRAQEVEDED